MDLKTKIPGIYRAESGALINKDKTALQSYKARKAKERKVDELYDTVNSLKNDMDEIKRLLKGLAK